MDIIELDTSDRTLVEEHYAALNQIHQDQTPDLPDRCREQWVDAIDDPWPGTATEKWIAVEDGRIVGGLVVDMPTRDNLALVEVEIWVSRDHRRRGIGRALHAKAVERAGANGRTTMIGGCRGEGPGHAFAEAMGATWAMNEVRRRWEAGTVPDAALDALLAESWKHAEGYELVTWRDGVPDGLIADAVYLEGRMLIDMPMGDIPVEQEDVDVALLRAKDVALEVRKRRRFNTGALHGGRLVAYTTIAFDHGVDWHGWQWMTIAAPEHRGHRLGTIVKLANLAFVRAEVPGLRVLDTWNAEENRHMIAINEAVGFRARESTVEYKQELA
ncbi:GNAT family N-acetyltransferase [Longispora fulva]|uniref:GNAT superfamily N-acetyltransferase n=1 Tax=Longispora fulva TaxID=619741 RepID=A0A8J7KS23_9ACTN|nr:GNAT family N-acetyltransferase [Longispora fulva]MBG6139137.1 GNAT superfamily N-acetyltransferase [Longispora fulva]GIG58629.1 GNAT family N-acetyltransferase [Longispora fulva]